VQGGSSLFVDSFRAAVLLRIEAPHAFNSLVSSPIPFHYVNNNKHFYFSRSTIVPAAKDVHGHDIEIDHVNYAPPFQAPFDIPTTGAERPNWRRLVNSLRRFKGIVEREDMRLEMTLKEGGCVVFANRRILHARREFDSTSGERWLKGTYVEWDDYLVSQREARD